MNLVSDPLQNTTYTITDMPFIEGNRDNLDFYRGRAQLDHDEFHRGLMRNVQALVERFCGEIRDQGVRPENLLEMDELSRRAFLVGQERNLGYDKCVFLANLVGYWKLLVTSEAQPFPRMEDADRKIRYLRDLFKPMRHTTDGNEFRNRGMGLNAVCRMHYDLRKFYSLTAGRPSTAVATMVPIFPAATPR